MSLNLTVLILLIMLSAVKSEDLNNDEDEEEKFETDTKNTELSPSAEGRFTYGDNDPLGPLHWRNKLLVDKLMKHETTMKSLEMKGNPSFNSTPEIPQKLKRLYAHNFCQTNWLSPINIETNRVHVPELRKLKDSLSDDLRKEYLGIPETLTFNLAQPNIQNTRFELGHPTQYHGIEIQSSTVGLIQLVDNFDPLPQTTSFTTYDFHFLSLFYCDLGKASAYRTMHQIDGKRYPLELEFIFLRQAPPKLKFSKEALMDENNDFANDPPDSSSTLYDGEYLAVIVSVLGEIGPQDNEYFKPVVDAAQKFHGKEYDDTDLVRNTKIIQAPWSPTWLLPDVSDYYYYDDASFPVPPCWSVQRYYVMRETIKISQTQLEILTHIQSERERSTGNLMSCTHSIAIMNSEEKIGKGATLIGGETSVNLNLIAYEMTGEDGKPRSEEEKRKMEEGKKQREIFRKRWNGERFDEVSKAVDLNGHKREIQNAFLTILTLGILSCVKYIFILYER